MGRHFRIVTDHAPLQWLSAQKMEGMLCRWALALQEYDFVITYRKGQSNGNADALSRRAVNQCAFTQTVPLYSTDLCIAQQADRVLSKVLAARKKSDQFPTGSQWNYQPFLRYKQLWAQLQICEGFLCRKYKPDPVSEVLTVPILPECLHLQAIVRCHDIPTAGHQGSEKTLKRLQTEAYWVGMGQEVQQYCRECATCQKSKLPSPTKVPLTNVPIGRPWQMIAVDILEVPLSSNNNRYLLVVQDYFTKWPEAIPLPDQTASRITKVLTKIFSIY